MRNSIKKIALGLVALSAFSLTACMSSGSKVAGPGSNSEEGFGTVVVSAGANSLNSLSKPGLAKGAVIKLEKLIVTATAVNSDTASLIIDTIDNNPLPDTYDTTVVYDIDTVITELTANAENVIGGDTITNFTDTSTIDQTISFKMSLKALRTWKISAKTLDENDSVVHVSDTVTVSNLLAGELRVVNLDADPLYSMYKADFFFPDSIFSPTGLFGQSISFTGLTFMVDGVTVKDTTGTYADSTEYQIAYDYVPVDADSVTIRVSGTVSGATDPEWTGVIPLYEKTIAITSLTINSTTNVTLNWVGPPGGKGDVTVEIGRVGVYTIGAGTDPIILD